ncbi:hypothetical protein [Micromonospora sp. NPDC004551]|uniref:hypothetical protein n=1 Tax=Micromonospora sp. NPDC004551 TaxID=3154284 RepID=UPI0033BA54C3
MGSRLHAHFVRYLEDVSIPTGLLEVWKRNSRARAFYTRHGRKPDGESRAGPDSSRYICLRLELMTLRAPASPSHPGQS